MQKDHGLERLVFFSDAVVAIAITLIILPLVDSARDIGNESISAFLSDNVYNLGAAALSFAVIGSFWRGHHGLFEWITGYTQAMMSLNFIWLAGIVFLPLPTVLIVGNSTGRLGPVIYIGTMLVSLTAIGLLQTLADRGGLLSGHPDEKSGRHWELVGLMALALVLAASVPHIGMWSITVLLVEYPIGFVRRRRARATTDEPSQTHDTGETPTAVEAAD